VKIFGKTACTAVLGGVLGLAMTFGASIAAHATSPTILAGAGSDTIYFVMSGSPASGALHPHTGLDHLWNTSQTASSVTEIPPSNATATGFPASVTVPPKAGCPTTSPWNSNGSYTWDSSDSAHTPPNGSSAGITFMQNDDASAHPGCLVDFARSSRGLGNPSDTPDLESYAFALDAVDWAIISTPNPNKNVSAPTTLSVSQLTKIYTCFTSGPNVGTPIYSNWNQVGGKNKVIVKYAPQTGSGTLSFFQTKLLGGATVDSGCNSGNLSHRAEENQLTTRCTGNDPTCNSGTEAIPTTDMPGLISPFSYAKWNSQKLGSEPDLRNGAKLEKVEGLAPSATTINEGIGGQPHFIGTRYVYNILTQNEPNYAAAAAYLGINQLTVVNGYLCQDTNDTTRDKVEVVLKNFGFTAMTDQVEGSGMPTGYCRFDATPL
jgi:ABC-type phosphate transport system substrate-binding protein